MNNSSSGNRTGRPRTLHLVLLVTLAGCRQVEQFSQFSLTNCQRSECDKLLALPLDKVQFKAAHNSVDRRESLVEQLQWDVDKPYQSGCRGVELDLVQKPPPADPALPWDFHVQHGWAGWTKRELSACLDELRQWSDEHGQHDVVVVHLDLKNVRGNDSEFPTKLDEILVDALGRNRIYAVADLMRSSPPPTATLAQAVRSGWPTLAKLRRRFLFIISGAEGDSAVRARKQIYARTAVRERIAFVDIDQRLPPGQLAREIARGDRVVLNLHFGVDGWRAHARRARDRHYLTRIWVANDEAAFRAALDGGVHILSTDKIRDHVFATVGRLPFRAQRN